MRRLPLLLAALLAMLVVALVGAACGDDEDAPAAPSSGTQPAAAATRTPEPRRVTFMAGFRAQANLPFVAVYVAQEKGYFAEEGLTVDIRHAAADEHLKLLLSKDIEFTTATGAQVIRRRTENLPLKAFALFGQRGDQGFVVRADSGIERPSDFRGRSVGFKSGIVPAELKALLATAGLSERDVKLQAVGFDPRVFIERAVDVYPVFLSNEPDTIRRAGVPIRVFDPAEYGVATLGLTFIAHEDTLARDPELARRFLRAALRGAYYASNNIDEAVTATLRYAEGADRAHQRYLLETDLANARRADGVMGRATPEQWNALEALLVQYGVIDRGGVAASAFDPSFVNLLYDAQGRLK